MQSITRASVVAAALALTSIASEAQVLNTGLGVGPIDANWTVKVTEIANPANVLYQGNAFFISPIPSVWQDNSAPTYNWIGARRDGNLPGGNGTSIAYRYTFTTNLLGSSTIVGSMGWDNKLVGFSFDGGANTSLYGNNPADFDEFGFCRTTDGEFDNKPQPTCTRSFTVSPTQNATTFSVVIDGDLRTDGLLIRNASTTVPEPSTYALMVAGLAGIFGVSRRRRNKV